MSDIKRQVSKMLAEEIVQTIKKLTDDNNKQYVNNQIKNIGSLSVNGDNGLVGGTISGNNFSQAIIDAIGKENFQNDVSAAIVSAIIGKFESLIGDTGVIRELYGTYANFINMVANNAQFDNVSAQNIWASIATMALARIDYLDVNHLIIRDKDGNRVSITVDENGDIVTKEISDNDDVPEISGGFIHGGAIGDGTVTGTKLVANAIETSHISANTFAQLVLEKGGSIIDLIDDRMSLIVKDRDNDGTYSNIVLTETMIKLISEAIRVNARKEFSVAINDITNDIDAFSKLSATANKIYWLIADGDNSSAFTLTPEMIELVSKNIKLTTEQLNVVIKDLDMSENESVSSMIQQESGSKATIYRDETPPTKANKNDLWVRPSTGYTYQLAETNYDMFPAFYLDEHGTMYYKYDSDQTAYELMLDESGDLYVSSEAPFAVAINENGCALVWVRVKDSELEQKIEDAKTEFTENIRNVQTEIRAEIGEIQTTVSGVIDTTNNKVTSLQTQITQNTDRIAATASRVETNAGLISKNSSKIIEMADAIDLRVTTSVYEEKVGELEDDIADNKELIQKNESAITLLDKSITSKVSQEVYDKEIGVVRGDISEIKQTANDIKLEVSKKTATFCQENAPGSYLEGDIWIKPSTGTVYEAVKNSSGVLGWQESVLTPSHLKTSYIEIAQDHIDISTGGKLNVDSGAAHFRTKDYTLSILADDSSEETVLDFDASSKTLRVDEIIAGNSRPYISGITRVTSGDVGGLDGLAGMLANNQYEQIVYTQTIDDLSGEKIIITKCNSLVVKIIADDLRRVPPIEFRDITGNVYLENLKWSTNSTAIKANSGSIVMRDCYADGKIGLNALDHARIIWIGRASDESGISSAGTCTTIAKAQNGAEIKLFGLIPKSNSIVEEKGGTVQSIDTFAFDGSSVVENITVSLPATVGYYGTYNGWHSGQLYQGYSDGKGRIYGCMKFEIPSDIRTVKNATLILQRYKNAGKGAEVDVEVRGSSTAFGSRPTLGTTVYVSREDAIDPGATVSFDVTTAAQDLVDGAIRQLVLYTGESSTMSGKVYSSQYARFDEATLKITY